MSTVYTAEPRSMLEPLIVYAYPRHPEDGTQVLVADVDTIDVLVFQGAADPIWQVLGADPEDYLSDTPTTVDGDEKTLTFTLNYGAGGYYPKPAPVTVSIVLRRADNDDGDPMGVLELTAVVPLRDSPAARVLGFK